MLKKKIPLIYWMTHLYLYSLNFLEILQAQLVADVEYPKISMFNLRSRYYIHFQNNTIGKGMNPFIRAPRY